MYKNLFDKNIGRRREEEEKLSFRITGKGEKWWGKRGKAKRETSPESFTNRGGGRGLEWSSGAADDGCSIVAVLPLSLVLKQHLPPRSSVTDSSIWLLLVLKNHVDGSSRDCRRLLPFSRILILSSPSLRTTPSPSPPRPWEIFRSNLVQKVSLFRWTGTGFHRDASRRKRKWFYWFPDEGRRQGWSFGIIGIENFGLVGLDFTSSPVRSASCCCYCCSGSSSFW